MKSSVFGDVGGVRSGQQACWVNASAKDNGARSMLILFNLHLHWREIHSTTQDQPPSYCTTLAPLRAHINPNVPRPRHAPPRPRAVLLRRVGSGHTLPHFPNQLVRLDIPHRSEPDLVDGAWRRLLGLRRFRSFSLSNPSPRHQQDLPLPPRLNPVLSHLIAPHTRDSTSGLVPC